MSDSMLSYLILLPVAIFASIIGVLLVLRYKEELFITILSLLLLGYLLAGKGIAYLGIAPIYVSEVTLVLGCGVLVFLTVWRGQINIRAIHHGVAFTLLIFIVWGAIRTVPNLREYRMDALRDAVIWGYAAFAFYVAILVSRERLEKLFGQYSKFLPLILFAMIFSYLLARYVKLPSLPDSPVPLITMKAGDAGVHLGGMAAFMMLRLDRVYGKRYPKWLLWSMWTGWGILWVLYGVASRSGLVSSVLSIAVVFFLRPKLSGWVRPAFLVAIMLVVLLVGDATGILQQRVGLSGQVSFEQITTNITSLVGGPSMGDQAGTIEWRLDWWRRIIGYTFGGEYLWEGKGFGINLATDDGMAGYVAPGATPNRHPHNITMNILARAGLPGLIFWLTFLFSMGGRLLMATTRQGFEGKTAIWLLAYWVAFLFNAQTDVFLEGPMGGIWFWALVGFSWVFIYGTPKWSPQPSAAPVASYALARSAPQQPA